MTFWVLGGHSAPLTSHSLSLNPVNLSVRGRIALGLGTVSGRQAVFHMGQSLPDTQENVPVMTDGETGGKQGLNPRRGAGPSSDLYVRDG